MNTAPAAKGSANCRTVMRFRGGFFVGSAGFSTGCCGFGSCGAGGAARSMLSSTGAVSREKISFFPQGVPHSGQNLAFSGTFFPQ